MNAIETIYTLLENKEELKSNLHHFESLSFEDKLKVLDRENQPRYFYKYMADPEKIKPLIEDGLLYLSSRKQFNDPFDTCAQLTTSTNTLGHQHKFRSINRKRGLNPSHKELEEFKQNGPAMIRASFYKTMNNCGLYCFSKDPSNILMWGHYSNHHKGLVIEFDRLMDYQTFGIAQSVNYTKELPSFKSSSSDVTQIGKIMTTKYDAWAYENEWRIFSPNNARKYYFFKADSITKIIFGAQVEEEFVKTIKRMIENSEQKYKSKIQIVHAKLSETEYKVIVD